MCGWMRPGITSASLRTIAITIPTDMAGNTAGTFTIATTGITRMRGGNRRGTVIGLLNSVANRMGLKPLGQGRLTSQAGGAG